MWYPFWESSGKGGLTMTIYTIRHGVTEWNAKDLIQGREDIPLSPEGLRQVALAGEAFDGIRLEFIVSSPLIRAVQTAEAATKHTGVKIYTDERLTERDFGPLSGTSMKVFTPGLDKCGMEELSAVEARMLAAVTEWAGKAKGDFAVVSHGGALTALLKRLGGWDGRTIVRNAGIGALAWDGRELSVLDWNMGPEEFREKYVRA